MSARQPAHAELDRPCGWASVWFDLDRNDVIFTTGSTSLKGRDIRRDPRISVCVDDERPPFSFVLIEGAVRLTDNHDDMGRMRAKAQGGRNSVSGELLVGVTLTRVVGSVAASTTERNHCPVPGD